MIAPILLAHLLSLAGASTDTGSSAAMDSPVPSTRSSEWKADSAWNRDAWSVEAGYREGIAWGDLRDGEDDMANRIDLKFKSGGSASSPLILLEDYALEVGFWHNLGIRWQVGIGYEHAFTFVVAGQPGIDLLLSENVLQARARYWCFRREHWQIGPKLAISPVWGTLTRYGIEKGATASGSVFDIAQTTAVLDAGSEDRSVTGWRLDAGLGMEVRIVPMASIGGALVAVRQKLTITDNDPVESILERSGIPYPKNPVQWEIGLELHAAFRF